MTVIVLFNAHSQCTPPNPFRAKPEAATADAGYFSEEQVNDERVKGIELYIATGKQKHGLPEAGDVVPPGALAVASDSGVVRMKQKLRTETGQAVYKMRKAIVERSVAAFRTSG